MQIIDLFEQGPFRQIELAIVLIFHIVQAKDDLSVVEAVVIQQVSTVDAFEQDGIVILQQAVEQPPVGTGANDIRETM
jgi:hypothetical protein